MYICTSKASKFLPAPAFWSAGQRSSSAATFLALLVARLVAAAELEDAAVVLPITLFTRFTSSETGSGSGAGRCRSSAATLLSLLALLVARRVAAAELEDAAVVLPHYSLY